jgi:hypothetical protein
MQHLDDAPRQFAIVADTDSAPTVVAWGQQFTDGAVSVLNTPGAEGRSFFNARSAEAIRDLIELSGLASVELIWT